MRHYSKPKKSSSYRPEEKRIKRFRKPDKLWRREVSEVLTKAEPNM